MQHILFGPFLVPTGATYKVQLGTVNMLIQVGFTFGFVTNSEVDSAFESPSESAKQLPEARDSNSSWIHFGS